LFEDDGERRGEGFTPSGYVESSEGSKASPGGSPGLSGGFDDEIPW
jgi:hypothetical protein